jgi:glutaredoxin
MRYLRLYLFGSGLLFALFISGHAIAEMYKWVDKLGITHIQGSPPEDTPDTGKIKKRGERNTSPAVRFHSPAATSVDDPEKTSEIKLDPKVELYVTSWCRYSQQAQAYFKTKGVPFTVYDIEKDPNARRRQMEINPTGKVPTVVINGNVIRGYNAEKFDRFLNKSR